jgi:hypothetical protein
MKQRQLLSALALCATAALVGQTGRDAYRQAYDVWQQAQANLERDAGTGGAQQVAQADRSASAAASFEATRLAYFKSSAQDAVQQRQILQTRATRSSPDLIRPAVANLAATELQSVNRAIAKFANDQDRGIQQLRQSLERERVALAALTDTIQDRQKRVTATSEAAAALEQGRVKTAEAFGNQSSQFSKIVTQMEMEGPAWANYYDKLAEAIQVATAPPPAAPVNVKNITPASPGNDSVSRVPLVRYVGSWTYPLVNGTFHGAQPDSVELEVHEKNGHADGTLDARFKRSPGVDDLSLRFAFEGDIAATPTQKFALKTSDGTTGTIELIPGPAFNLLEVNFQTEPRPNKIRSGNFILVKK